MHETDKDIEELQSLLGPAVSDYRSLRSRAVEVKAAPRRAWFAPGRSVKLAVAAVVAIAVVTPFVVDPDGPQQDRPGTQVAISTSVPSRPGTLPTVGAFRRPAAGFSQFAVRPSLPRNPARTADRP